MLQPRTVPIADLTLENLKIFVTGMNLEPGYYSAADLHGWYVTMARDADLEPINKKEFGASLKALGYRSSIRRTGGVPARCWFLSRRAWRGLPPGVAPDDNAPSTGTQTEMPPHPARMCP